MRRAIQSVASAERLYGRVRADRERRRVGAEQRAADRERRAADREHREGDSARLALRAATAAYVRHLREAGEPPERTLVRVKGILSEAQTSEQQPQERVRLHEDVMRWSIEAYYATG